MSQALLQTTSTQTEILLKAQAPVFSTHVLAAPHPLSAESGMRFFTTKKWLLFSSDSTNNPANKRVQIYYLLLDP